MSENDNEELGDDWAAAMEEQAEGSAGDDWDVALKEQAEAGKGSGYDSAEFPEFDGQQANSASPLDNEELKLDVILDVPVTISMEIGRTKINIRNLLQLNQGSVVELDRLAGEPMDVLVNGTLIAHGEVVVVNDKFGIRLTDVISPAERVKKLG
ncbi:flagellar motor switch protein FliN [Methylomarinum vadi]|uniref:flagellar motor switch protein FliN n=1 Tax=Methylomarinum vadi TaxID=438855 RepID=UPI0004DF3CCD|nr:flagellar motor switch protein FliN [Methylomarinum vadi]